MMIRYGTTILLAGLFAAAPASAQSHSHGQSGQSHGSHGHGARAESADHGGHGAMCDHDDAVHRHAPKKLLGHRDMLELTAAQVEQLEALHAAHEAKCKEGMEQIRAAETAANAALELSTPDVATFSAKLREAANLKVDCRVDMVRTGQAAVALLTAGQQAHLAHMKHAGH